MRDFNKFSEIYSEMFSQEKIRKSSSQHKELHPRYSSTSLQKHSNIDDMLLTTKIKSDMSISKSSTDVTKSSTSGELCLIKIE